MEKRTWVKPEMNAVTFAANEYVSLCLLLTCNLMGNYDWVDTNENGNNRPSYHNGRVNYGSDMSEIHQKDQCGSGSSAGGAWFNTDTQKESGTNGAAIQNVWLDKDGNSTNGYEFNVTTSTPDSILKEITTAVGAVWQSVLNGSIWNHVGVAKFVEKNAANS